MGFLATLIALWIAVPAQEPMQPLRRIIAARVAVEDTPRTIDVPVDTSIARLDLSVEALPGITVTVLRPGGTGAAGTDADVTLSELRIMDLEREIPSNLKLFVIARPQPGVWQVVLTSVGARDSAVRVQALGSSHIAFDSFEFVRKQEGVHGGYFRIDGMPLAGGPATARATLRGGPDKATFRLVDESGTALRDIRLTTGNPDTVPGDFLGTFGLPAVPFRVVINASDESGAPIQRQYSVIFRAQPVAVFFGYGSSDVIEPGTSRRFTSAITNVGSELSTFAVTVKTSLGEVVDLAPATVTIRPGTSATASFSIAIPANAERFSGIEIRITATDTADPSVKNSASADLELARPGDADNDSVADSVDNCRDVPNHNQHDTNRDGMGDACDSADGGPLSISALSPESGPPGTIVKIKGTGFSATAQHFVMLNGLPALATWVSATELEFTVPAGAPTGPTPLVIGANESFTISAIPFIVRNAAATPSR
jgi:hypothetical protein